MHMEIWGPYAPRLGAAQFQTALALAVTLILNPADYRNRDGLEGNICDVTALAPR